MASRNYRIDNMKAVLIILVVIGHFLLPVSSTRFTTNSQYLIYSFHMPAFVFLSGYLAKGVYRNGKFRWEKAFRLAWLYILFEIGVHITEGLLAGHIGWKVDFFHESGAPWYLLALLLWYFCIPICAFLKKWKAMTLVLAVGLAGGYAGRLGDFLAADRVLAFAPFFFGGYFCTGEEMKAMCGGTKRGVAIGAAMVVAAVIFLGTYDYLGRYTLAVYGAMYDRFDPGLYPVAWVIRLASYGVAVVLTWGLLAAMPDRKIPVLTTVGQRTLSVYVLHRLIRDLFQYVNGYRFINVHSKVQVLLMMAGCVILTFLLASGPVFRSFQMIGDLPFRFWNRKKAYKKTA